MPPSSAKGAEEEPESKTVDDPDNDQLNSHSLFTLITISYMYAIHLYTGDLGPLYVPLHHPRERQQAIQSFFLGTVRGN